MTNQYRILLSVVLMGLATTGAPAQQSARWQSPAFAWYLPHHPEVAAAVSAKSAAGQIPREAAHWAFTPSLAPGTFTTFDAPEAAPNFYAGTKPIAINTGGTIAGTYQDASLITHGFIRTPDGTIRTVDVPGDGYGTYPVGIDEAGDIAGYYCDANFLCHGFWYSANGTFTTFDAPGASAGTYAISLDSGGGLTGYYWDKNYFARGFLRAANGMIKAFGVTGAANGTYSLAIGPKGLAGVYEDASYALHGFVATQSGFTSFDPPGQLQITEGIYSFAPGVSVNRQGQVAGYYFDPLGQPGLGAVRGFIRDPQGAFTTFDAGPVTPCCLWTMPYAINDAGVVAGSINDDESVNHGFLRAIDGAITFLDVPGAGTGNIQGTVAMNLNSKGVAIGVYIDSNFGFHGFLYQP